MSRGRAEGLQGWGAPRGVWELGPVSEGNHRICGVQVGGVAWVSEHHTGGTGHENLDLKVGTPPPTPSFLPSFFPFAIRKILI